MNQNLKPSTQNSLKKITAFWNYFRKNEPEILNAFLLGINNEEVISRLTKKLDYVSRRIAFVIEASKSFNNKFTIIFTAYGYRKLFPKIIALENHVPALEHFVAQAFIKPLEDPSTYREGTDEPCSSNNLEIKISEIQIALKEYNIATKQMKIDLYLHCYNELQHFENLESNIDWIIMQIVGEIAFRKHLKEINLHQMPLEPIGLLPLIDLPDFIAYLYEINSRKKTRLI